MPKQTYKQAKDFIYFIKEQGPRKDDIMFNRLAEAAITTINQVEKMNYASNESIGYLKRYSVDEDNE